MIFSVFWTLIFTDEHGFFKRYPCLSVLINLGIIFTIGIVELGGPDGSPNFLGGLLKGVMRKIIIVLGVWLSFLGSLGPSPVLFSQDVITFENERTINAFPEGLTFAVTAVATTDITSARLVFAPRNAPSVTRQEW